MIKFIQKQMNKDGFTLVELIIVIAVMAILAAIVVPRMSGITNSFRERADERMAETFARELEVQVQNGDTVAASGAIAEGANEAESVTNGDFYYFLYANIVYVYVGTAAEAAFDINNFTAGHADELDVYVIRDTGGPIN